MRIKVKRNWRYWLKEVSTWLVLITILMAGMDLWRKQSMPSVEVPEMIGRSVSGEPVDVLKLSKEKPVILYFWATWCTACKFVTPTIDWISDSEDYEVVGVTLSSGTNERVARYMKAHNYHFTNLNDSTGRLTKDWGISVTPTIAIIKDGKMESVTTGITTPPGILLRAWLAK